MYTVLCTVKCTTGSVQSIMYSEVYNRKCTKYYVHQSYYNSTISKMYNGNIYDNSCTGKCTRVNMYNSNMYTRNITTEAYYNSTMTYHDEYLRF